MNNQFDQQLQVADKIETAVQQPGTDASRRLLDEANSNAQPFIVDQQARQNIDDKLIVDNNMWNSARDIFTADTLAELFPAGPSDQAMQDVANGNNGSALESLVAEAVLDARKYGALDWTSHNLGFAQQLGRMDVANTLIEVNQAISPDRFNQLAAGDDALSASEVTAALQTVTDPREKQALQDLLRVMGAINDQSFLDFGGEQFVRYDSLQGRMSGEYQAEVSAIEAMKRDAVLNLSFQQLPQTEAAPLPDTTTTDTTTADTTTDTAPETTVDPTADVTPEMAMKAYSVQPGEGFDRIARAIWVEKYGIKPSPRQEIELSAYIAGLNNNDRDYSNGILHVGDQVVVPDASQVDLKELVQQLRAAS